MLDEIGWERLDTLRTEILPTKMNESSEAKSIEQRQLVEEMVNSTSR